MNEKNSFLMKEAVIKLTGQTLAPLYNIVIQFVFHNSLTSKPEEGYSDNPKYFISITSSFSLAAVFDLLSFHFSCLAD